MHYAKIAGVVTGIAALLLSFGVYAAEGEVVTNGLNIRAGATTEAAVVGKADAGERLTVEGRTNNFYILNYNGTTAYASCDYVSILSSGRGAVNTDVLNMRAQRSTSSDILNKLAYGEEVNIVGEQDGWYQILYYGQFGYVSTEFVSVRETADTSSRGGYGGRGGAGVVAYGENYLGTPYKSGGTSPSGFDCSGFTYYVYKNFGVELPHSSAAQAGVGVEVARGDIQAGDLLFFNTYGGISHVAIAVDSDTFIHATVPGDVVKYSSLNSQYYSSRYVTARRIIR